MNRLVLAAVATVAFAVPAVAQQSQQNSQPGSQANQPLQNGQRSGESGTPGQAANQQPIMVEKLGKSEISQLQQALKQKGFNTGDIDGVWGPETRSALQNFKQQQGFSTPRDEIDARIVQALGLDAQAFQSAAGQGGSQTTGQGSGVGSDSMRGSGSGQPGSR
jgi:peptidoglycan hydrolase-like protein with peptidoglycan-binding domain